MWFTDKAIMQCFQFLLCIVLKVQFLKINKSRYGCAQLLTSLFGHFT